MTVILTLLSLTSITPLGCGGVVPFAVELRKRDGGPALFRVQIARPGGGSGVGGGKVHPTRLGFPLSRILRLQLCYQPASHHARGWLQLQDQVCGRCVLKTHLEDIDNIRH